MTNYYEELKLDQNLSVSELRENLIRLESIWTDRASTRPEKATEMLALINQAKKVFATDLSKAVYDQELLASSKAEDADPDAVRKAEFEKWKKIAEDYYDREEYDMAKTALDRALQNADENDFAFLHLAAQICRANTEFQAALSHINKAILIAPDLVELYMTKALVLEALYVEGRYRGIDDAAAYLQQARKTMHTASEKAAMQGNKTEEAHADGALAYMLYFYEPSDIVLAERLAKKSIENGNDRDNARRVLKDLAETRIAAEKAAQAEQQRREQWEREEQARRERLAREEQERQQAAQRRQQERAAKEKKEKQAKILDMAGWAAIIGSFVLLFVGMNNPDLASVKAVAVYCSAALFNYADGLRYGEGSGGIVTGFSFVVGLACCFLTANYAYYSMGFSASSAAQTWKIFGIMLVVYAVVVFAATLLGRRAYKKIHSR